jgi:hypothetical protein
MAYTEVPADEAAITLYKPEAGNKNCIRMNRAAWVMLGRPTALDVLFDAGLNRLAIRSGSQFQVVVVDKDACFSAYAKAVYDAAGIDLKKETNYAPQAFAWGEGETPEPGLQAAVWIQL